MKSLDLYVFKAQAKVITFTVIDDDGDIVDLSGLTGQLKVYLDTQGTGETPIINKSITLVDAPNGICTASLTSSDSNKNINTYKYRLEINHSISDIRTYQSGLFLVVADDATRISEIKTLYGLEFDDLILKQAFLYSHNEMKQNAFEKIVLETNTNDRYIYLENYLADSKFDRIVNDEDIEIIEYMITTPFTIVDLSSNITETILNHPMNKTIIKMDDDYPTNNRKLKITYYKLNYPFYDIQMNLNKIEELYMFIYLFKNLDVYKLQRGLPDRSINGVTIKYDQDGVYKALKSFNEQVLNEIAKIRPFKLVGVRINKGYTE